ncbi:MAG: serine/threonine-protein kinase [Verrucomicrobiales bacterium]
MNSTPCPDCGSPVPANAPGGHCPVCLVTLTHEAVDCDDIHDCFEFVCETHLGFVFDSESGKATAFGAEFCGKIADGDHAVILRVRDAADISSAAVDALELRSKLVHSNIAKLYAFGEHGRFIYAIVEHPAGRPLGDAMQRGGISRREMLVACNQVRAALEFAAGNGVELAASPGHIVIRGDSGAAVLTAIDANADFYGASSVDRLAWAEKHPVIGIVVGNYRLIELLGEGGFAEVYIAEQMHPIQRRTALKFLKAGMDSDQVVRRFEAERQMLALMTHPNIAQVYDAGTTDAGRPYFSMELVEGVPITNYCNTHNLALEAMLALFATVCEAVQHAHEKGIIHRDLKPSNILVTDQNGGVRPKIIDFGIAKAIDQPLSGETLYTKVYHFVGSPDYMSPEQFDARSHLDARADVYALGCVLYELLVGITPLRRTLLGSTPDQMAAVLGDELPPPPSAVAQPGKRIAPDLEAVVMKALEKKPPARYPSAAELAADLSAFLKGAPVSARRPGFSYVLRCWQRRLPTKAALAALVGAVVVGAAAVVLWPQPVPTSPKRIDFVSKSRTADGRVVPVCLWNFNGDFSNSIPGAPPMSVAGQPALEFQGSDIAGQPAQVLGFPKFLTTEYLMAENPIGPNGYAFATETNEYTLVMDVMFPEIGNSISSSCRPA